MNQDFEKLLDHVIAKWPDAPGSYNFDEVLKGEFGTKDRLHLIRKFTDDETMIQQGGLYSLTVKGHEIQRNLSGKGYVAMRNKETQKESREEESFKIIKSNLLWTKISAIIFFATLLATIIGILISMK